LVLVLAVEGWEVVLAVAVVEEEEAQVRARAQGQAQAWVRAREGEEEGVQQLVVAVAQGWARECGAAAHGLVVVRA